MSFDLWFLVLGSLLVVVALIASVVTHLPFTTTILYLLVGLGLGAFGVGAIRLDPLRHAGFLERVMEIAVLVSLFTATAPPF